jgi:hypothetical protein
MVGAAESLADTGTRLDMLAAVLELVDKGLIMAVPLGDEAHFVVLHTVSAYVARLHSSVDDAGSEVPGGVADIPLSQRERAVWPGRSAA